MKWILVISLFVIAGLEAQDEIIFKDRSIIKGEVDPTSITDSTTSVRFKPQSWQIFTFYNLDEINFVKAWNGEILYPIGVVVNLQSGKYHLPNVKHAPQENNSQFISSVKVAEDMGLEPCNACFDSHPRISDYALEQELVKATIIHINNTNEIMYEHSKLPKLQHTMNDILNKWPENLKGYKYRVQVIRDEQPNAFAVAGGNLYFTSGLLNMIEGDLELEGVLAHEIAHVERRHYLRGYKEKQNKKNALALATAIVGLAAIAVDSDEGIALAATIAAAGHYALEFTQIGYERDLEQEADIMAQIYLKQNEKELRPTINFIDKLATTAKTRYGYVPKTNAFSSHPDLLARIEQIENGELYKYDVPMKMIFHPHIQENTDLESGFMELNVKYAYKTISSDKKNEDEIILMGSIINRHKSMSFQIKSISLNLMGTVGVTNLGGIVDVLVPYESETDFIGRIKSPKEHTTSIVNNIYNKKVLPFSVNISGIVIQPGKNALNVVGMRKILCTMTIN